MRRLFALVALLFAWSAHAVEIDWVRVGDPGNQADTEVMTCCGSLSVGTTGFGSVGYVYRIGMYEVTNAQYAEFLNAVAATDTNGLYDERMDLGAYPPYDGGITRTGASGSYSYSAIAGRENMPVNLVSFYDALRFTNWLHNGQPSGGQDATTTEDGAYTITVQGIINNSITRNASATIFLPSEDEWYKAAYFNGTSYFDYPAGSDIQTVCAPPGAVANTANCLATASALTDVGSYSGSASPYGTFDQGGNIAEWNEAILDSFRGYRGGRFSNFAYELAASFRGDANPSPPLDSQNIGFRVATIRVCDDGLDNDADGLADYPSDPGCADVDDLSENSPLLPCDDGADNDGDGRNDFDPITYADPGDETTPPAGSGDPGCKNPTWFSEEPLCQDGIDNDGDGMMDYDAGLSRNGVADPGGPDPQCVDPYHNKEGPLCGQGAELALVLPPLMWLYRRRGRRV